MLHSSGTPCLKTALLLALISLLASCELSQEPPLRVGMNNWLGYAPLYIEASEGKSTLTDNIQILTSASAVMHGLRNGMLEAGALTLDEAISLSSEGVPLDIVLVFNVSQGADAIIAREGIESVSDLAGKIVAVERSATSMILLKSALNANGISLNDINVTHCSYGNHLDCFETADAVVTFEPMVSTLLGKGGSIIFDSSQAIGLIYDVLVVNRAVFEAHTSHLQQLATLYFENLESIQSAPEKLYPKISQMTQLTDAQLSAAYKGIRQPSREENISLLNQIETEVQALQQFLIEQQLLPKSAQHQLRANDGVISGKSYGH